MNPCVVREATASDSPEIEHVSESAIEALRQTYRPTPEAIANKQAITPVLTQLVALIDAKIVGSVEYRIEGDRLHFLSLFVHEVFRRHGVAKSLIAELERIGRNHGLRCLSAYTITQTGNPRIFRRMGFDIISEEPTMFYESQRFGHLTEAYMERSID